MLPSLKAAAAAATAAAVAAGRSVALMDRHSAQSLLLFSIRRSLLSIHLAIYAPSPLVPQTLTSDIIPQ